MGTEIPEMKEWADQMQLYPLITMNKVPKSVFAFRSQNDPRFCVGVKPTPHPTDDKVYACTAMHEVHSGVQGWELGIRAGRLEPFVELKEAETTRKWTMYSDM